MLVSVFEKHGIGVLSFEACASRLDLHSGVDGLGT
jgi:hypothetical protein